jgi:inner membrane protein
MDNLCHTLVGAAMGYAGLKRTTRFANATLMIAANLPDVDVLVFFTDTPSIAFRRGWTHGIAAQLLLPLALTAIVVMVGRRPGGSGLGRAASDAGSVASDAGNVASDADSVASGVGSLASRTGSVTFGFSRKDHHPPLSAPWLLLLSYLGIYSHVFLDFLNNYGVRLLTPFDWRWFYGDAVFIIDVWLWLMLGLGIWLSRRAVSSRPARIALVAAAIYIAGMFLSARASRAVVSDAWRHQRGRDPQALMVGPVPLNPFVRQVIVDAGDHYELGELRWLPSPDVTFRPDQIPKNADSRAVRIAQGAPAIRSFLVWSRFPFYQLRNEGGATRVSVGDMRFSLDNPLRDAIGRGRFTATVLVPRADGN